MMKRTKRYGGFLVGDRVRVKDTAKTSTKGSGRVIGYNGAKIIVESYPLKGIVDDFMSNQLINLTRQEEQREADLEERFKRMRMEDWKPEDHDMMLGISKVIRFSPSDLPESAFEDML